MKDEFISLQQFYKIQEETLVKKRDFEDLKFEI